MRSIVNEMGDIYLLNGKKGSFTIHRLNESATEDSYPSNSALQHLNSVIAETVAQSLKDEAVATYFPNSYNKQLIGFGDSIP